MRVPVTTSPSERAWMPPRAPDMSESDIRRVPRFSRVYQVPSVESNVASWMTRVAPSSTRMAGSPPPVITRVARCRVREMPVLMVRSPDRNTSSPATTVSVTTVQSSPEAVGGGVPDHSAVAKVASPTSASRTARRVMVRLIRGHLRCRWVPWAACASGVACVGGTSA